MPVPLLTGANVNNQRILNVASPSAATDAVNKSYVDNLVGGLSWKNEVRAAATGNVTLASAVDNGSTLDGVTIATGDRVLLPAQTDPIENGIWIVPASGAPTRAFDADSAADLTNATVSVAEGDVNEGKSFTQTEVDPVPGTDPNNWTFFATGISYTPGDGLQIIGNEFSILLDSNSGLVVGPGGLAIDDALAGSGLVWTAGVLSVDNATYARRFATSIGNGSNATLTVTHNFGTRDVKVELFDTATYESVYADVTRPTTNTCEVTFPTAPSSNAYRALVSTS